MANLIAAEPEADVVVDDETDQDDVIPYKYAITAYGADYPVDGLVKRLNAGDVVIPSFDPEDDKAGDIAGFQRKFIWTKTQCDRFVESLLLGFPVPGVFLVRQPNNRLLVLDGQQRLRTLQAFYKGVLRGKEFSLIDDVQVRYAGKTYATLEPDDRRRLDDSIIHATVVRQDEPGNDQSSIYMIFERLNTGGTTLTPQEIRVALYRGPLIQLLRELNEAKVWRELFGKKSATLKDHELILRFLALFFRLDKYQRPMKEFLNQYLEINKNFEVQSADLLKSTFINTITQIHSCIGARAFRLKTTVNAALADSIFVGVAKRLANRAEKPDKHKFEAAYASLIATPDFVKAISKSTADEAVVADRLARAIKAFAET